MLLNDELSSTGVFAPYFDPVKQAYDFLTDYERAGNGLNDPSGGLLAKLWTMQVLTDTDGVQNVTVSAPGVPATVLFSGSAITEASLAFDQNMRPFVAYIQANQPKIYWYDSSIPAQIHTLLPVGIRNLRCTMDEKRQTYIGISDIILAYINNDKLCVRYQRDRYEIEYELAVVGANATLISIGMNEKMRIQFRLKDLNTGISNSFYKPKGQEFLSDVVMSMCIQSGIEPWQVDVSELKDDIVYGLKVESDEGLDVQLSALADIFFFDKAEFDKKLRFPKRGRFAIARIPYFDLVDEEPPIKQTLANETTLPKEFSISHTDPDGGYAQNKQTARRSSNLINAKGNKSLECQVVLSVDQAASAALTKLKIFWNELRNYEFSTTKKWTELTPGDVVEVEDSTGIFHLVRLEERNEDDGILKWKGVQDAGSYVYGTNLIGNPLPPPKSTTPGLVGETRLEILNIPVQFDEDDELGVYIAAAGSSSAWGGYVLTVSTDGGISYSETFQSEVPATIGDTLTVLYAETGYEYQSSQTVDVKVNFTLESISYEQLLGNMNRCVIGDEVLQFQTADLLSSDSDSYTYRLSGLVRGRYATTPEEWPTDTRFVLIDNGVVFAQSQIWMLGTEIYYKAISFGATADETTPLSYDFDVAVNQTEFPVTNVEVERIAGDVIVNWVPVARLGVDTSPYNSKYFDGFKVKFDNGHEVLTSNPSYTYVGAPAGISVQICQMNKITGEGPFSDSILV